jgi:hypothetical protein
MLANMNQLLAAPSHRPSNWLILFAMAITVAIYWVGLHGPFLLDDGANFEVLKLWSVGRASLTDVLASGQGMFGRPISMAALALNTLLGGLTPFSFKLGNVAVHLLCGAVIYLLVRRIASHDARLQQRAEVVAALIASLWLLHPLHASTVLYSIQRMTQMSALFVLLGMLLYMAMRDRLERGTSPTALIGLFAGIPALTVAAFLCKENGVLLPLMCFVLELGCFRTPRPRAAKAFSGLFVLLPLLAGAVAFAINPARLLGGYAIRTFDWQQRLLTQPRALCDYLWQTVAPNPSRMGIYTDDFAVSTGLIYPYSTLPAILLLLGITVAALRLRRRLPALFVGWGIFLAGHAMESTILPLELYFEHRNYLPMLGLLYTLTGLAFAAYDRSIERGYRAERMGTAIVVALLVLLAFGTYGRARVWSSQQTLAESAVAAHPDSMRAQLAVVSDALGRGDTVRARSALDAWIRSSRPRWRAQGHLNRINLDCATRHAADPTDLAAAVQQAPSRVTQDEATSFSLLVRNTQKPCTGINDAALALAAAAFADAARSQPDSLSIKAELRHSAASLHARTGDWAAALPQAKLAWQPRMPAATSAVLVQAQLGTGDIAGAERTYAQARARATPADTAGLQWLRGRIDSAKAIPTNP